MIFGSANCCGMLHRGALVVICRGDGWPSQPPRSPTCRSLKTPKDIPAEGKSSRPGTRLRKGDHKLRTLARLTLDRHFAVVGFNDGFYQAQAKAEAALGTALVATVKPLPDARLLVWRDAHAGVAHPHGHATGCNGAGEADVTALGRVFERVVEEVREGLAHAGRIHNGFARRGEVGGEGDALFLGDELVEFKHICQQRADGSLFEV